MPQVVEASCGFFYAILCKKLTESQCLLRDYVKIGFCSLKTCP